jgi:hypothetical protein
MDGFGIVRSRPRRLTAYARAVRQARIFARLRGWAHDDIARDESLSTKRVRQIVSEALQRRPVSDDEMHVRLQIERLSPALKAAGAALANGRRGDPPCAMKNQQFLDGVVIMFRICSHAFQGDGRVARLR